MNEITKITNKIIIKKDLSIDEAHRAMQIIIKNGASPAQIASYITALSVKGIKSDEIVGTVHAISAHINKMNYSENTIYIRSTGTVISTNANSEIAKIYAKKNNIHMNIIPNVSLAVAAILKVSGMKVVMSSRKIKHQSATSSILSDFGYNLDLNFSEYLSIFEKAGLVFIPENTYLPKMVDFSFVSEELGFTNIVDAALPLISPINPKFHFAGAYLPELQQEMIKAMQTLEYNNACVISNNLNIDKIIPNEETLISIYRAETHEIENLNFSFEAKNFNPLELENLEQNNSKTMLDVLNGVENLYSKIVTCNAAAALYFCNKANNLDEAELLAKTILQNKHAYKEIKNMISAI